MESLKSFSVGTDIVKKIGQILSIYPRHAHSSIKAPKSDFKFYNIFCGSVVIVFFILSTFGRKNFIFTSIHPSIVICESIFSFLLTLLHLFAVYRACDFCKDKWIELFKHFKNNGWFSEQNNYISPLRIIISYLILFLLISLDSYIYFLSYGLNVFLFYLFEKLQYVMTLTLILIMSNFLLRIKSMYQHFNVQMFKTYKIHAAFCAKKSTKMTQILNCNDFSMRFSNMSKIVCLFNDIFGWDILFLLGCSMISLLNSTNIIIIYGSTKTLPGSNGFSSEILTSTILLTFLLFVSMAGF